MSDTRTLLNRISSFRRRLEEMPHLIPNGIPIAEPSSEPAALLESRMDRTLVESASMALSSGPLPPQLTMRARLLLEEARELLTIQRNLTNDPIFEGLSAAPGMISGDDVDPIVQYHQSTISFTDAALRIVQAFPGSSALQLKMCEGVEVMLHAIRDRLTVAKHAVEARRKTYDRIDGLAKRLNDIWTGRFVDLEWCRQLAEEILSEARRAEAIRFLSVDPRSACAYAGGMVTPAPARSIAAHAITTAQIVARITGLDYEWAGRPLIPIMTALLMDVGMLGVPTEVLAKTEPLTVGEMRQIETHAHLGAERIRTLFPQAEEIAAAIANHHERPDGTGYPNAAAGDRISSLARMLAVCDAYAAMVCERTHRPARDPRTALTDVLIAAEQGRLDRDFSEYLLQLSFHPVGVIVELTDGRIGVVVANHTSRVNLRASSRPVVAILTDARGNVLPRPEVVDLAAAEQGSVVRSLSQAERVALLARDYPELCE